MSHSAKTANLTCPLPRSSATSACPQPPQASCLCLCWPLTAASTTVQPLAGLNLINVQCVCEFVYQGPLLLGYRAFPAIFGLSHLGTAPPPATISVFCAGGDRQPAHRPWHPERWNARPVEAVLVLPPLVDETSAGGTATSRKAAAEPRPGRRQPAPRPCPAPPCARPGPRPRTGAGRPSAGRRGLGRPEVQVAPRLGDDLDHLNRAALQVDPAPAQPLTPDARPPEGPEQDQRPEPGRIASANFQTSAGERNRISWRSILGSGTRRHGVCGSCRRRRRPP